MLAGMNVAAGPKLAAAVTNAGGLGVIGGVGYTPDMLREQIAELKGYLNDKNAPFGIDLLLPQVGGSARKTKSVARPSHERLSLTRHKLRLHKGQAERARRYCHRFGCQAVRLCCRCASQGCY
jgi:NAD(P)H-dependent flavin oxidoreductase YrpB (nitropropane dioxygenase family)